MTYDPEAFRFFLPKRLVQFADGGGPEAMGPDEAGEGGAGVSEEAAEREIGRAHV